MTRQKRYWLCQLLGWGAMALLSFILTFYFSKDDFLGVNTKTYLFSYGIFCAIASYLLFTHLLRLALLKLKWLSFPPSKTLITLITGVLIATIFSYFFTELIEKIPNITFSEYIENENKQKAIELEKELNVANTEYYKYETTNGLDSVKYKSVLFYNATLIALHCI